MAQITFLGHPLHPQLIAAPLGLLPFSCVMDAMYMATGKRGYAEAGYYSLVGGYAGAAAAGLTGVPDYLAIPDNTPLKRDANTHVLLNVGIVGLYTINLALRARHKKPSGLNLLLSAIGTAGVLFSQWFGGDLVYRHGLRVKNVSPIEDQRELKLPGDDYADRAFQKTEEFFPQRGVTMRS